MLTITTINNNQRMSTQDLLMQIHSAVAAGETEFQIEGSGQHDIGGPLWNAEGKTLKFYLTNPGQRVGSMCLPGTEIYVQGSAPADVGWLNAGGKIVVEGDGGDTTGHCSALGTIYIGGRAGTRSGSLMKHDPDYAPPELWILKNTGSFSFEMMGGGIAVVCGHDSEEFESVLGDRACTGMVGGIVYFRGQASGISRKDVKIRPLEEADIAYLSGKMGDFLGAVGRPELAAELSDWSEWQKVCPLSYDERPKKANTNIMAFRTQEWVAGGIFSDVCVDDFKTLGLVNNGVYRLKVPVWENERFAAPCEFNCRASIPSQQRFNLLRDGKVDEAYRLILDYTPFPASVCGNVCPNLCMDECTRQNIDVSAQIGLLGRMSEQVQVEQPAVKNGRKVGVIGGGVGGLTTAWQLARMGYAVTVFEADAKVGGKLEQVIPRTRLAQATLQAEIQRIADMGVAFKTNTLVDKAMFAQIRQQYDAVVVATGGHVGRVIPWPGHERIVKGIDFLKSVNRGETVAVGKNVVVIGCGNAGMDVAVGAYQMGAEQVTCIDVQKPAAFAHEIEHVESLGGKILWPVSTKEITVNSLITDRGEVLQADTVIISIGESPDLTFLPEEVKTERGYLVPGADQSIAEGVFAVGDTIKPALLVDAIGSGRNAAFAVDGYLSGSALPAGKKEKIPASRLTTAYFTRVQRCDLPSAAEDHARCISCGTCRDCRMCLKSCPEGAISRNALEKGFEYVADPNKCIGCGICAGICPCGIWSLTPNAEPIFMYKSPGAAIPANR